MLHELLNGEILYSLAALRNADGPLKRLQDSLPLAIPVLPGPTNDHVSRVSCQMRDDGCRAFAALMDGRGEGRISAA